MSERETEREKMVGGRESVGESGQEGERERQHLTMMTIEPEHFNCMQTASSIIERERERERGLCPFVKC